MIMSHQDATALPDLFPSDVKPGPVATFVRKHPAIVVGRGILVLPVLIALAADWLWTIDPEKISPIRRNLNSGIWALMGNTLSDSLAR